jgi:hypothetical protein
MKTDRNYWPVGIILGSLFFVGVFAAFVVIACTHKSELVSENYYDQEIKFQKQIDSATRAQHLTPISATYDHTTRSITISLPREQVGQNITGEIVLYRPSASGQDRQVALAPDNSGNQTVYVADAPQGLWRIRVQWNVGGSDYYFDQKLVIESAQKFVAK